MNSNKIFSISVIVLFFAYITYFVFIKTLSFSELTGKNENKIESIFINAFDFDTELTRYDVYLLKSNLKKWNLRIQSVEQISNINEREVERQKLVAEMLEDPSFKKIFKKTMSAGIDLSKNLFAIIKSLK